MGPDAFGQFLDRIKLILIGPLEPVTAEVEGLSQEQATLHQAIGFAASQLMEDVALELALSSASGLALTMLEVHKLGYIPQPFINPDLQRLAEVLVQKVVDDHSQGQGTAAGDASPDPV